MALIDLSSYKVADKEKLDPNKFDNLLDAISAGVNSIDQGNIAAAATPTMSKLTLSLNTALALTLSGAAAGITVGGDTNLYRLSAGSLKTDGQFQTGTSLIAATEIQARSGSATQVSIGAVGPGATSGITFQNGDANLYRDAASSLTMDGGLRMGGGASAWGQTVQGGWILVADNIQPASNPTSGGILFAVGGALKWRGSAGTITTIAAA